LFKNYFITTIRNIRKSKIFSVINITGLAIGLACFILIIVFIRNEISYDTFHERADRIYRPVEIQHPPGVGTQHVAVTMGPLAPALQQDFPEIVTAARIMRTGPSLCRQGDLKFYEEGFVFADPQIFDIFTIPIADGDRQSPLKEPNSLVISQSLARKYFGSENPIGKTFSVSHYHGKDEFIVTAVMKDYPENSHLTFDLIAPYPLIESKVDWLKSWGTNTMATYVLLREGTDVTALEAKFPEFIHKYNPRDKGKEMGLYLQSLKDIHLRSGHIRYQTFNHNQGNINSVYIFSAIALFILLIACINFMNLSTARSLKRAKEVGIRKVLGSSRRNLVQQFIGESVFISFLALALGLIILELFFPYFQSLLENQIPKYYYSDIYFLLQLVLIALLVGIVSGSYPAFFLSSFQPGQTLKGTFKGGKRGKGLRKFLVVFQFAIAIALISSTGIIRNQLDYIRNKNLGYNTDQVVYLPLRGAEARSKARLIKNELLRNPNVVSVSATAGLTGASGSQGTMTVAGSEEETKMMMRFSFVDFDYIKTMEMQILQGRDFSPEIASDTVNSVILNRTAVKELGWTHPLGMEFKGRENQQNYKVIGIVNDFHFYTLHQKIEPLIMWVSLRQSNFMIARIRAGSITPTLEFIENTWRTHFPQQPVEISFLDEHFEQIYKSEQNTGKLFGAFSFLAIFIACLGLFGLASFTAEQKTKEIGIRKVLGASIPGIVVLLSREFIKWVAVACFIGFPLAYFTMREWMNNFVYRANISSVTFLLAALLVILIALTTVSYQAVKAARANPVDTLKYE
jgi:putative ABC transport system permease protein